ncbi:HAD-like domain-containing protein [Ochromonadaceae sp. CCMP2298]|nr:HAD-like domain-containing protein [Ochromonadaceae sp. CCMP2298]
MILQLCAWLLALREISALLPAGLGPRHFTTRTAKIRQSSLEMGSSRVNCKSLVVWDCDGVLVDSEALLKQGEVEALAAAGFDLSVDDCVRLFSGVSTDQAAYNFQQAIGSPLPPGFFQQQIQGSLGLFSARLQPLMSDTVADLHAAGHSMCVASGSPLPRVTLCLELAGMQEAFPGDRVFTRELVARGKPAPDLFLYSAEKMGVAPDKCIVVEDSAAGVEAALAAGMDVIAFLGGGHAGADWYAEAIARFGVPVAHTQEEVLALVRRQMC